MLKRSHNERRKQELTPSVEEGHRKEHHHGGQRRRQNSEVHLGSSRFSGGRRRGAHFQVETSSRTTESRSSRQNMKQTERSPPPELTPKTGTYSLRRGGSPERTPPRWSASPPEQRGGVL